MHGASALYLSFPNCKVSYYHIHFIAERGQLTSLGVTQLLNDRAEISTPVLSGWFQSLSCFPPSYTLSTFNYSFNKRPRSESSTERRAGRNQNPLEPRAVEMVIMKMILGIAPWSLSYGHMATPSRPPVMAIFQHIWESDKIICVWQGHRHTHGALRCARNHFIFY